MVLRAELQRGEDVNDMVEAEILQGEDIESVAEDVQFDVLNKICCWGSSF